MSVELDDVTGCPLGDACESCGVSAGLTLATAQVRVGVYCLTLCGVCVSARSLPQPPSWRAAVERVMAHCEHLGIDGDEMAQLLETES